MNVKERFCSMRVDSREYFEPEIVEQLDRLTMNDWIEVFRKPRSNSWSLVQLEQLTIGFSKCIKLGL